MGDNDHHAGKMIEIIFQDLQGLDIQIVGRFVQDQDIRVLHQDPQQIQPPLFPAGQLADGGVLLVAVEQEALAHGGGGDQTFRGADEFRPFFDIVDHTERFVESFVFLAEVSGNDGLTCGYRAGVRLCEAEKDPQKSGFAAAVGADDADTVIFQEGVGEIVK